MKKKVGPKSPILPLSPEEKEGALSSAEELVKEAMKVRKRGSNPLRIAEELKQFYLEF